MITDTYRILPLLLLSVSCEPDTPSKDDTGGLLDSKIQDSLDSDDTEDPPGPECPTSTHVEGIFELDPTGPDTQIHPAATFDDEAVWLVWNRPDKSGDFAVWGQRLDAGGEPLLAPLRLDTRDSTNRTQPRVARQGDRILAAWQSDNSSGKYNLDIHARALSLEGAPLESEDHSIETSDESGPLSGNIWMPSLAANPGRGFTLAASAGLPTAPSFQLLIQNLDPSGLPSGLAETPEIDASVTVFDPVVAVSPEGQRWTAWERWGKAYDVPLSSSTLPGSWSDPLLASEGDPADGPSLAALPGGAALLAFHEAQGDDGIALLAFSPEGELLAQENLGLNGETDHGPAVAWGSSSGLVAWYRLRSGNDNDIVIQRFTLGTEGFTLEEEQLLPLDEPAMPYPLALTHTCEDHFFLAWTSGDSPAFRLHGSFLSP